MDGDGAAVDARMIRTKATSGARVDITGVGVRVDLYSVAIGPSVPGISVKEDREVERVMVTAIGLVRLTAT